MHGDDVPDPFGSPMPYSISVGWNTNELERGMNADGHARLGGAMSPVASLNAARGSGRLGECTRMCWFRQRFESIADDLARTQLRVYRKRDSRTHMPKTPVWT